MHYTRWYPRLLQRMHQGIGLPSLRPLAKPRLQLVLVCLAPEQRGKAFILRPRWLSHGLAQRLPVGVCHTGDSAPAVLTLTGVRTVWRCCRMVIAHTLRLAAGQRI